MAAELGTSAQTVHRAERLLAERKLLKRRGTTLPPIVALSRLEFALVRLLGQTPGHCVPPEALIRDLWPDGGDRNQLNALVGRVCRKLGSAVPITTLDHGYTMELKPTDRPGLVEADELVLDPVTGLARDGKGELPLSQNQFAVLLLLAKDAGSVVSRPKLVEALRNPPANDDALTAVVHELRLKLGEERIATHRGHGYRLVPGGARPRPPATASPSPAAPGVNVSY